MAIRNRKKARNFKCAVNGTFKQGNLVGMCGHIVVNSGMCGAHGNHKCAHKIDVRNVT